jgi:hypothetical protein
MKTGRLLTLIAYVEVFLAILSVDVNSELAAGRLALDPDFARFVSEPQGAFEHARRTEPIGRFRAQGNAAFTAVAEGGEGGCRWRAHDGCSFYTSGKSS